MDEHQQLWQDQLFDLENQALLRKLRQIDSPQGAKLSIDGKEFINFSANDYLGLATHPALTEAAVRAIRDWGTGSGASRLISGNLEPHVHLEERLAAFKNCGAALSFSSGYTAALSAISTLAGRGDVVILDKLAHACLIDGARLSGAKIRVFPHNNTEKLESLLAWARAKLSARARVLVVTESVFGMDGDVAPLVEIARLCGASGAMLLVDEAHGTGTVGPGGRGLASELGLVEQITVHLGTLSKALGAAGGFLAGSSKLIELIINRARPFIYSTAPTPAAAAAATAAVELLQRDEGQLLLNRLHDNIRYLLDSLGRALPDTLTPIVPVIVGSEKNALAAAEKLWKKGVYLPAIRYPTVAKGSARLRISLSASHSHTDMKTIINVINLKNYMNLA